MPKKFPKYTLVQNVRGPEEAGRAPALRLQFRGPKIESGERALANGTLPEILAFARTTLNEDAAQRVLDDAVDLQLGRN